MSATDTNTHPPDADLPGPEGAITLKLTQDDAVEIIERLRESHADSLGRAFLINLDTIIETMGAKWEVKRDLVFSHLKTSFERKFPEPNWCIAINDNAFLAVIMTLGEYKGALSAAELWFGVGQFFVGDVSKMRPPLFEALAKDVDVMTLIPIDLAKYFDRAQARPFRNPSDPLPGAPDSAPERQNLAVGTMTAVRRPAASGAMVIVGGRNLRVTCALEPLFEMKKMAMIGHRLEATVVEASGNVSIDAKAMAAMDWSDREQVDLASIEQGLKLLALKSPEQRKMLVVVPAAFSTFAAARTRIKITNEVSRASREMGIKVLFEVRNLSGVPPHRILEVISLLKPYCMTLMGNIGADQKAIARLRGCGLSGACVDYDSGRRDDATLTDYLSGFSTAAKASTGACMVKGFDNLHQVAVARLAGITHASVKATGLTALRH